MPLSFSLKPLTPSQGVPVSMSLSLRAGIPDVEGKTLHLTCQLQFSLQQAPGTQPKVTLQILHTPASLLARRVSLSCLLVNTGLCDSLRLAL